MQQNREPRNKPLYAGPNDFQRVSGLQSGERTVSSTNGPGKIECLHAKEAGLLPYKNV